MQSMIFNGINTELVLNAVPSSRYDVKRCTGLWGEFHGGGLLARPCNRL